ncbi:hypothetical protein NC99_06770 [Sunxiuqinia dokdonensis]|uniref:Uncharacterized protein n=1 Tax=Sunxiuqinia dokdonensis TaxID=1409788 RepID=A0A0L8VDU6_9BACT|nr:hypothetical protein NC99_06770 [Sunxiuqinia dokdonensis]
MSRMKQIVAAGHKNAFVLHHVNKKLFFTDDADGIHFF